MTELPILLVIGVLLASGLACGSLAGLLNLPLVVGYVVAGVLFSPDLLGGWVGLNVGSWSDILTQAALGVIAYLIGGSVTVEQIKRLGQVIISVALFESLGAVLLVFAALMLFAPTIPGVDLVTLSLIFAAISASTAPASTVAILHQYRAKGPMCTTLLGVVAVDDAIGIILFSVIVVMLSGDVLSYSIGNAFFHIFGAVISGAVLGFLLARLGRWLRTAQMRVVIIVGAIFLAVGGAEMWHMSVLLSAMSLGFFTRLFVQSSGEQLFSPVEYIEEMVFVVFFTLAGIHFEASVFFDYFGLIAIYFVARVFGKVLGAGVGAHLAGAPPKQVRWIGYGLFPQAGVAIGLSLVIAQHPVFSDMGVIVVNVILASTLLYELVGPFAVRLALHRVGELGDKRGGAR